MTARPPAGWEPLRVVVLGASGTVETSWRGGPRADLAYPRVLERELFARGLPVRVRVEASPGDRVAHASRAVVDAVHVWQPDVVVVHLGQADSVHLLLPRWLERHANSPRQRPGRLRALYRRALLRPAWIGLAKLQVRLDGRIGNPLGQARQRRTAAELADLLDRVRATASARILVCTLVGPGPPWRAWFPGLVHRMATLDRLVECAVAERADPRLRVFPLAEVVAAALEPGEEPTPDGGHFTARIHGVVGEALAEEISAWLALPS